MDEELYQAFITESEESITQLNNSLLTLESNPEDHEAIDDIFRRAHTLKGNFGAMGFDAAATVAHAIEDLLDEVRQGGLDVTPERMDLVFEGVDLIVDILHDIEQNGETSIDTEETVTALRVAAEGDGDTAEDDSADAAEGGADDGAEGDDEDGVEDVGDMSDLVDGGDDSDADGDDGEDRPAERAQHIDAARETIAAEELSGYDALHHVDVTLATGDMKSVDAGLFLDGIPDDVTVAGAVPSLEEVGEGAFDDHVQLFVADADDTDTVAETFGGLWAVSDCTVTDVSTAITRAGGSLGDGGDGVREGAAAATDGDADADGESETAGSKDSGPERSIAEVKSVRVDVDQLDELHELVEQLVTSRIKLRQAIGEEGASGVDTLDELDKISSNLQNTVMDMRLIPLKKVFDKFPRLVRDLARAEDKRVDFRVEGQDIELDRTILDEISDPLMHVLRNAVDHGIEPPEERVEAGKPEQGTVTLSARREHDTVVIEVSDDGGGLDLDRIREKAVSKGLTSKEAISALPDEEVFDYIFHPGFSTNDQITDVSGRGVGMDVVKTTVEALDGSVSVDSTLGDGTTFKIRLPVSVAIIKVLFVLVGDRQFGVPIKYIDEVARQERVDTINGDEVVVHDDRVYPLIRLRDALGIVEQPPEAGMVVRIRPEDRQVALWCDGVTRQEEVVVTPLQGPLSNSEGLSGTAVIGDGNVIPIIDIGTLSGSDTGGTSRMYNEVAATDGGRID
ncbi:chemotaxis protein CheA [Salinigranum rubrum]|uniref:Chemotaxis protein CheA n=1 Tax=Salinigranum rubrum TaxID=755307 RepID=A0A2I8VI05_9EURY|nr:chemotaxis protein CheA [Salinigranum rubrum]AUV81567.1 chemotaxis protein CheA [Salinigranum rubrum]